MFACVIGWSGYGKRLFVFSTEPLASSELLTDNVKSSAVYDKLVLMSCYLNKVFRMLLIIQTTFE